MRDFFLQQLNSLDKLTGLQQLNKLMAMEDPKKEINDLLDILCRVCNQFSYIPEPDMQRIISENILSDYELTSLNGKIIFKWLSKACSAYYKEPTEEIKLPEGVEKYEPLTGEARDKALETWKKSLQKLDEQVKPEYSGSKLKATLNELPAMQGYVPLTDEEVVKRQMHIHYIRENYDPKTKDRLPNWVSESEWEKMQGI
jgi:NADH:ubiquinone oxidoreductase subunit E